MGHVIEYATSGRAKCRGCETKITESELRFGERQPNPFGDGEMTLWFHLNCAAYKRPEPFLEALESEAWEDVSDDDLAVVRELAPAAELGIEHRRLPRIDKAGRAPTGRARCRSCRELIDKDGWRIGLVFFEDYRFQPSGFIHAGCAKEYFGTPAVLERIRYFSPALEPDDVEEIAEAVGL